MGVSGKDTNKEQVDLSLLDDLEIIGSHDPAERAQFEEMIRSRAAAARLRALGSDGLRAEAKRLVRALSDDQVEAFNKLMSSLPQKTSGQLE